MKNKEAQDFMNILTEDIKEGMFKIETFKNINSIGGVKNSRRENRGRKAHKLYNWISVVWYDSFWKKYCSKDFLTPAEFNEFLNSMKQF